MPINVTCPTCHTRFKVSDQFAGKEGPCPKCKATIKIPDAKEQVVVHEAENFGPKDSAGRSVLKPIFRQETKVTNATWVVSIGLLLAIPIAAWFLRDPEQAQPIWLMAVGSLLVAFPICRAGYAFLRDDELEPFVGQELWIRISICAILYAATWAAITWIPAALGLEKLEVYESLILIAVAVGIGTAVSHLALEIEIGPAIIHYAFYLGVTVLLRLIMGLGFIPYEIAS